MEFRLIQPVERGTNIRKIMEIHLSADRAALSIDHRLENCGLWTVELAPWAITQLPMGGTVILPFQRGPVDENELLPNRKLVLWPYTRWQDPRLELADDACLVHARSSLPPVKVGTFNRLGWAGYFREGVFLRKTFSVCEDQRHPDEGCNVESYCNDLFIELETVGPLAMLEPGSAASLSEHWEFFSGLDFPQTLDGFRDLIAALHL